MTRIEKIKKLLPHENELTYGVMAQVGYKLGLDFNCEKEIMTVYYETAWLTDDWPEGEGFGSSDYFPIIEGVREGLGL